MERERRPQVTASTPIGLLERLFIVLGAGVGLAALDLHVKSVLVTPAWAYHHRSDTWFVVCIVTLVGALAIARVPSLGVSIGSGLLSGGVLGNLVSADRDGGSVPDPLIVVTRWGGVAFNAADVFTILGIGVLVGSLMAYAIRNRDRLRPPTRAERWLLRRLGR